MKFTPRIVTSIAAVALTCLVSAAAYYYKHRKAEVNEVMIFCKLQYNVFNYFDKLLNFIESAEKSIHICMPTIHNPAIQDRLIELVKRKNITARIIIDRRGYNESTAIFLEELIEAGAVIKWKSSDYKMHHKFCLVDDETLMTGTLDWGNDLSFDNWNYVYVTSKKQLVEPVRKEFHQMWDDVHNTSLVPSLEYADDKIFPDLSNPPSPHPHPSLDESVNVEVPEDVVRKNNITLEDISERSEKSETSDIVDTVQGEEINHNNIKVKKNEPEPETMDKILFQSLQIV